MSAKASYFRIGLFVISTVIIIIACIIFFGSSGLFEQEMMMETYIDGSVQGLSVGSPVKHRGVKVGAVKDITFLGFEYDLSRSEADLLKYARYVRIVFAINPAMLHDDKEFVEGHEIKEQLIEAGMRVRLATQDLTGNMYLEFDYLDPVKYPPLAFNWIPRYPYMPSAPSVISRLSDSAQSVFSKLENTDLEGAANELQTLLQKLNDATTKAQIGEVSEEVQGLIKELRRTNKHVLQIVEDPKLQTMTDDISTIVRLGRQLMQQTEGDVPQLLKQLQSTVTHLDQMMTRRDGDIEDIITNLRKITIDLREITNDARAYPSNVLFGDAPRKLEP